MKRLFSAVFLIMAVFSLGNAQASETAYDIDKAKEICDEWPLQSVEGIWVYPDDKVTVLILKDSGKGGVAEFESYSISVVQTDDSRLHPGDKIGYLYSTAKEGEYRIELSTERKNDILLKSRSCLATLSKDEDALLIKKQKAPFRGRLNLNFNRLLPGFWKVVSTGISTNGTGRNAEPAVGMVKIYPSYDGNGSSRRRVRYL